MNRKKLTHKVRLTQGNTEATFKLTDKEYEGLIKSHPFKYRNILYIFAAFAWADYELSRYKANRFNKIFGYHKGDIYYFEED